MLPLILGFVLGGATILFALQNPDIVALSFLTWSFESSLAMLILLAVGIGVLLGMLFAVPSIMRRGRYVKSLRRDNKELATRIDELEKWNADTVAHYEAHGAAQPTGVIRP